MSTYRLHLYINVTSKGTKHHNNNNIKIQLSAYYNSLKFELKICADKQRQHFDKQ